MTNMSNTELSTATKYGFHIPPTDEEREELMNPEYWDWDDPTVGIPVENPRLRIGIDLDPEEANLLGSAAHAENMPISHYIKKVALDTARHHR